MFNISRSNRSLITERGKNKMRPDVITKAIIRGLKRYYISIFSENALGNELDSYENREQQMINLQSSAMTICQEIFSDRAADLRRYGVTLEQVSNFILTLVVPGKAKELELLGQEELMTSFHAVI